MENAPNPTTPTAPTTPSALADSHADDILCITRDGVTFDCWRNGRLWELAANLPVEEVPLETFAQMLDETETRTNREWAHEAKRTMDADLRYPVILSAEGWMFDGGHRVRKAYALGLPTVRAVRFSTDPEPDYRKQAGESLD